MSQIDDDIESNPSDNERFSDVLDAHLSRRQMLTGGVALAASAFLMGAPQPAKALLRGKGAGAKTSSSNATNGVLLGFTGIGVSSADEVVVPAGYTAKVLIAWGDPLSTGPAFAPDASNTAADQEQQWGMHNDGVHYFEIADGVEANGGLLNVLRGLPVVGHLLFGSAEIQRGLLVQNHEYTDDVLLFTDGTAGWNAAKTAKSLAAHGVSVIEVEKINDEWTVKRPSSYARRITGSTPITIGGPAAGHALLKTAADPTGTKVLGTLNNCAHGWTPWKTYLACEENFNGYFRKVAPGVPSALEVRYGINASGFGYLWHTSDSRFDATATPNEPNRFGWVTEIDPFDPESTPVKRTALGRFKHEGAWVVEAKDKRVVVYSGDDERNEYVYRYVSNQPWPKALADGKHPLDDGVLYVAKFKADGTGEWLPLTTSNPALASFADQADILIRARQAADALGATKMDRPEWIDVDLNTGWVYCTLTNNSSRNATTVDAVNPRPNNVYGHIVRWRYAVDYTEPTFAWEIFALAGDPAVAAHGSTIVGDKYGSPDGIYCAPSGRLWIQTDVSGSTIGSGAYSGFGNNQMLCADPNSKETRRFLVGPKVSEITGVVVTPDERTMFVGIQHPGEAPTGSNTSTNPKQYSSWPDGPTGGRPRSSTLVITKDDGGQIGS